MEGFQPTATDCLKNFKRAQRLQDKTFVEFASWKTAIFDYYCNLRSVKDFNSLKELIISDKLYETLDAEIKSHIGIKQGEEWFKPQVLGREWDLFYSTQWKALAEVKHLWAEIWKTKDLILVKNILKEQFKYKESLDNHVNYSNKSEQTWYVCIDASYLTWNCPEHVERNKIMKIKVKNIVKGIKIVSGIKSMSYKSVRNELE